MSNPAGSSVTASKKSLSKLQTLSDRLATVTATSHAGGDQVPVPSFRMSLPSVAVGTAAATSGPASLPPAQGRKPLRLPSLQTLQAASSISSSSSSDETRAAVRRKLEFGGSSGQQQQQQMPDDSSAPSLSSAELGVPARFAGSGAPPSGPSNVPAPSARSSSGEPAIRRVEVLAAATVPSGFMVDARDLDTGYVSGATSAAGRHGAGSDAIVTAMPNTVSANAGTVNSVAAPAHQQHLHSDEHMRYRRDPHSEYARARDDKAERMFVESKSSGKFVRVSIDQLADLKHQQALSLGVDGGAFNTAGSTVLDVDASRGSASSLYAKLEEHADTVFDAVQSVRIGVGAAVLLCQALLAGLALAQMVVVQQRSSDTQLLAYYPQLADGVRIMFTIFSIVALTSCFHTLRMEFMEPNMWASRSRWSKGRLIIMTVAYLIAVLSSLIATRVEVRMVSLRHADASWYTNPATVASFSSDLNEWFSVSAARFVGCFFGGVAACIEASKTGGGLFSVQPGGLVILRSLHASSLSAGRRAALATRFADSAPLSHSSSADYATTSTSNSNTNMQGAAGHGRATASPRTAHMQGGRSVSQSKG